MSAVISSSWETRQAARQFSPSPADSLLLASECAWPYAPDACLSLLWQALGTAGHDVELLHAIACLAIVRRQHNPVEHAKSYDLLFRLARARWNFARRELPERQALEAQRGTV